MRNRRLTDPEFIALMNSDPELSRLKKLSFDAASEFAQLLDVFGFRFGIGTIPVKPLTTAGWSLLWALGNAFTRGGDVTLSDMDIALYIMSHDCRDLKCRPEDIPARASGYALASGIQPDALVRELSSMIDMAFRPLAMIPRSAAAGDGEEVYYDADWAVRTASIAARESNTSIDHAMFEMPLSQATLLFVSYRRRSAPDGERICRRQPDATLRMMLDRVNLLQQEYLKGSEKNADNIVDHA